MEHSNSNRETTLRFLAEPTHVNFGGKVHGGSVMKWIDQAGYACAAGWTGHYCVTVFVSGIRFYQPLLIGSVVEVQAKLIYTGTTSAHILVSVRAGDPRTNQYVDTSHCIIVFVAMDDQGHPVEIKKRWCPETIEDRWWESFAKRTMEFGKSIEEEMRTYPNTQPASKTESPILDYET